MTEQDPPVETTELPEGSTAPDEEVLDEPRNDDATPTTTAAAALTDGTGVSKLLASKVVKDAVADLLLSVPAVFVGAHITGLGDALAAPTVVAIGLGDAVIRWGYRVVLRWATS